jgi:hypothetical protein
MTPTRLSCLAEALLAMETDRADVFCRKAG